MAPPRVRKHLRRFWHLVRRIFEPIPPWVDWFARVQFVIVGLLLIGVSQLHRARGFSKLIQHIPGGTPTLVVSCLLILVFIAAYRVLDEQETRDERHRALEAQSIELAKHLRSGMLTLHTVLEKGFNDEMMMDMRQWGGNAHAFVEENFGVAAGSMFESAGSPEFDTRPELSLSGNRTDLDQRWQIVQQARIGYLRDLQQQLADEAKANQPPSRRRASHPPGSA